MIMFLLIELQELNVLTFFSFLKYNEEDCTFIGAAIGQINMVDATTCQVKHTQNLWTKYSPPSSNNLPPISRWYAFPCLRRKCVLLKGIAIIGYGHKRILLNLLEDARCTGIKIEDAQEFQVMYIIPFPMDVLELSQP